ncbi:MAG: glycosyltransferase [Patescibacteria group bacterium]
MKIALVHDYLSQDGGAEKVLDSFRKIWPKAPIFVLFHDKKKIKNFSDSEIHESFLASLPFSKSKYQWYLPLMPMATEKYNLRDFDIVISSTSAFSKGILTQPETMHICYCHTPTRYLWTDTHEYIADLKYNKFVKSFLPRLIHKLRIWDKMSIDRVDFFIANSNTVRDRIEKYYRRESDIIYPPVKTENFYISEKIKDYFVSGGRLVPYKRFDLLIQAFNRLGLPLKIFGDGPELKKLKKIAKDNIEFLGKIDDKEKAKLMSEAKAFIHPQVEDLGITPIESMACGRPVIAFGEGGATETVIAGKTGEFFYQQNWESLFDKVLNFDDKKYNPQEIRNYALKFSEEFFKEKIKKYVEEKFSIFKQKLNQCRMDFR